METYYLDTLLAFLHQQKAVEYETLETVIGILESDELPPADKKDAILFFLRKSGLNEVTHKEGNYLLPNSSKTDVPKEIRELNHQEYIGCHMVEIIILPMLNGSFLYEGGLN